MYVYVIVCNIKHYLMQPHFSLMNQLLYKVRHKQYPGYHQQEWKDKRDGLQVSGESRQTNCQSDFCKASNHCRQEAAEKPYCSPD